MRTIDQNGFALFEAVIAIGLAAIFFSAIVGMMIIANRTSDAALDHQRAVWVAQEGVEALRTIAFNNLTLTETGALSYASDQWSLSETGPEDLGGGFERTVRVQEVFRNDDCEIVTSGGEADEDSRYLESHVEWTDIAGRAQSTTFRTLRTRWDDPQGGCFGEAAAFIVFDTSQAVWGGSKQLRETFLTNTGTAPAVIDRMRLTWDNSELVNQLFIKNSKVWSNSGPGTPGGDQPSGTWLDVENYTIEPDETVEMHKVQFTDVMENVTMTLEIEFTDGSVFSSDPFVPED